MILGTFQNGPEIMVLTLTLSNVSIACSPSWAVANPDLKAAKHGIALSAVEAVSYLWMTFAGYFIYKK